MNDKGRLEIMENPLIPTNLLKRKILAGEGAVGTFVVEFRQPSIMILLANAGFDFATIDNEHGAFSIETIADLSKTAVYAGLTPLVRIPDLSYPHIAQTLDVGAQGLMVPRITTPDQVRQVIRMMRYPPLGERGNAMERGLTRFRSGPVLEALEAIHQETFLIIQIETLEAVNSLEQILAIDGVDAVLIGPNDLSIALGVPGQTDHPRVQEAIEHTIQLCQKTGICPAIHMGKIDMAVDWANRGMRLVSTGSEVAFINRGGSASVTALRQAYQSLPGQGLPRQAV
jgi:2-keto-3-deoxy-L-rhamnonate aldolase RhmA